MSRVSARTDKDRDVRGGRFYADRIVQRIGDRRITLYRRNDVADSSWFFCVYLREEQRQYRVSLRTSARDEAKRKAETILIELLGRVRNGEKILSPSLDDVLRDFKKDQELRVTEGRLSSKTVQLQSYRIKLGFEFLATKYPAGNATKVTAVDGEVFKKYLAWRKEKRMSKGADKTIRLDVVRDELLSIRKVFLFARDQKLCSDRNIPVWDFAVERQGPKRRRVTRENYTDFINCIKSWKAKATTSKDRYHREMLFHFVLVVSNTGLRTGELLGLMNRDLQVRRQANECLITVRSETSKVRKGRDITVNQSFGGHANRTNGINYLIRWIDKHQIHKNPNDLVFSPFDSGSKSARDIYYHCYKQLRGDLKEVGVEWFDTYHCRHFWITNRLYAGEPIHLVARAAGTSTDEIEKTYSNVLTELATRQFGKNRVIYRKDGSYEVVTTTVDLGGSASDTSRDEAVETV
jgi:integrase